jgi:cellobiose-specific phosphotransferase system component IIC
VSRRRLTLLIAGAAFIWLVGAALLAVSLTISKTLQALEMDRFAEAYKQDDAGPRYEALYEHAKQTHEAMATMDQDRFGFMGGSTMTMALLILCWAIDRHRLMKRLAASSAAGG